jgi:hypothetical protein
MACRLVALDKSPGVRPVGIGEVYHRLMAKCLLKVVGHQVTDAAGNLNLCANLPAGIEGAIHTVRQATGAPPIPPEPPKQPAPIEPPGTDLMEGLLKSATGPARRNAGRQPKCWPPRGRHEWVQRAGPPGDAVDSSRAQVGHGCPGSHPIATGTAPSSSWAGKAKLATPS